MKTDVLEEDGKKVVLQGNEAIVRGALEAGVGFATAYPGTPSTEIPVTFSNIAQKLGIYFEYSTNEKIAVEAAAGAAWCGVRSMTSMKHFGLNVASDSVLPIAYTGVRAGFVIVVADDPGGWSSVQSEQDTRFYARMAKIPMLEPSNPQECLDFTKIAFEISEKFKIPVFLRTATNVSHSIGTVKLGKVQNPIKKGDFKKNQENYDTIRPHLQELHKRLNKKISEIEKDYCTSLNKIIPGEGEIGIITSGVSFEYCKEALNKIGIAPPIAKIGLSYPLSKEWISNFIKDKKVVLVLEELEPVIEDFVKQVAKDVNPALNINGKNLLPTYNEYTPEIIITTVENVFEKKQEFDLKAHAEKSSILMKDLPPRKPVLCPGCPHRSTFYAIRQVFGDTAVYAGDIGCCILGAFKPYEVQDFCISMGASLGFAHGIKKSTGKEVIAILGDSTFFHAGLPAMANIKFNNKESPIIIILDNSTTAMTGHQPHPGSQDAYINEEPIKIEEVVKSLGANVIVANAFDNKQLIKALNELKNLKGVRVLISKGECSLITKRKQKKEGLVSTKFKIDQEKCKKCGLCVKKFACPAIIRTKNGEEIIYEIDTDLCMGCSACSQICPHNAISPIKK